jgi:hypothetical protein
MLYGPQCEADVSDGRPVPPKLGAEGELDERALVQQPQTIHLDLARVRGRGRGEAIMLDGCTEDD